MRRRIGRRWGVSFIQGYVWGCWWLDRAGGWLIGAQAHTFMYTLQDEGSTPSFGVVDANFNPVINITC